MTCTQKLWVKNWKNKGHELPPFPGENSLCHGRGHRTVTAVQPHLQDPSRKFFLLRTDLALFMMCVIWGVNFSVIKIALDEFEPLAFNALRFPLAAATLFVMLRLKGPIPLPKREHWVRIIVLGLLANVVYQFFFIFGIDLTLA
ncbi:uncharacterized protein METZ01_LOCUS231144, partial [marine metagenome]